MEHKYKNYDVKDGYVVQTKMFNWDLVMSIDYKEREETAKLFGDKIIPLYENGERNGKTGKSFSSWEAQILFYLNRFALDVDVLEIIPITELQSSYHGGTFSKTSETHSDTPQFQLVYQVSKETALQSFGSVGGKN